MTARVHVAAPITLGAGGRVIISPFQFVVTGEDNLQVTVRNRVSGVRVRLRGRFLKRGEEQPQVFTYELAPDALENELVKTFPLSAGVVLNLVVQAIGAIVQPGECYVRVDIIRGLTGATIVIGTILAGYVGSWGGRAWPGSPLEQPTEGPGRLLTVQSGVPGAGSDPLIQFIGQERLRLIAARATLTTALGGVNRSPVMTVVHGGVIVFQGQSSLDQSPDSAKVHTWGAGVAHPTASTTLIGEGSLPADCRISTIGILDSEVKLNTFNLAASDQWTALSLLVERWMNPATLVT